GSCSFSLDVFQAETSLGVFCQPFFVEPIEEAHPRANNCQGLETSILRCDLPLKHFPDFRHRIETAGHHFLVPFSLLNTLGNPASVLKSSLDRLAARRVNR